MGIVEYGILNDTHWPYESKNYDLAISFYESRPNLRGIYLNGDLLECESVSRHAKHPLALRHFSEEIDYALTRVDELEGKFQGVPVTLLEGNHSHRLFRFIRDQAPQLFGMRGLTLAEQLLFPQRPNFSFVPYGPSQVVQCGASRLFLRHEPLSGGANHARGTAQESDVDLAYGHTHVYQVGQHKKFGPVPRTVTAYSLGWLGNAAHPIFDYRSARENWTEIFTLVQCEEGSGEYKLQAFDVSRGSFIFEGRNWGTSVERNRKG